MTTMEEILERHKRSGDRYYRHMRPATGDLDDDFDYDWTSNMCFEDISEKVIDYNDKQLIVLERMQSSMSGTPRSKTYYLVPGFIVGQLKKYDPSNDTFVDKMTDMTKVEIIPKELRDNVKQFLNNLGYGNSVMWD